MSRYAAQTSVPSEKSRMEIERNLARYGATSFAYGTQGSQAMVMFEAHGRRIRFVLNLPDRSERRFTHTEGRGLARTPKAAEEAWEQACRQSWRALSLVILAKLEAVEAGISEFEDEFLAHVVLPDNSTFGQWARPQLERVYAVGAMPTMLELGR